MKFRAAFSEMLVGFCVSTTFICILQGVLGCIFMPDVKLDFGVLLSPPLFGFLSTLLGVVEFSSRELTVRQVLIRRVIHLLLIEGMVFGLNILVGNGFTFWMAVLLALGIAVVYICVYVVLWVDELRYARVFNEKLKEFQKKEKI